MNHSLLRSLHHLPGGSIRTVLADADTLRVSGEINDQTHFEKRERIVGVHYRCQVQPHAEGALGTAQLFKRESPDERTELTGSGLPLGGRRERPSEG